MSVEPGAENCFVCGQKNRSGLKLKFRREGNTIRSEFVPGKEHEGWNSITHGGILTAVMDDAMAYGIYFKGIVGFTAKMEIRFRKPVTIGTRLLIYGEIVSEKEKHVMTRSWITFEDGELAAEAKAVFSIVEKPEQQ
jgi:acyl-coenzyme A thioesterase PaaI-like protein